MCGRRKAEIYEIRHPKANKSVNKSQQKFASAINWQQQQEIKIYWPNSNGYCFTSARTLCVIPASLFLISLTYPLSLSNSFISADFFIFFRFLFIVFILSSANSILFFVVSLLTRRHAAATLTAELLFIFSVVSFPFDFIYRIGSVDFSSPVTTNLFCDIAHTNFVVSLWAEWAPKMTANASSSSTAMSHCVFGELSQSHYYYWKENQSTFAHQTSQENKINGEGHRDSTYSFTSLFIIVIIVVSVGRLDGWLLVDL